MVGRRATLLARFTARPLCRECGYDLTGNLSGQCPECGTLIGSTVSARA
jgi:rubrerythrin